MAVIAKQEEQSKQHVQKLALSKQELDNIAERCCKLEQELMTAVQTL